MSSYLCFRYRSVAVVVYLEVFFVNGDQAIKYALEMEYVWPILYQRLHVMDFLIRDHLITFLLPIMRGTLVNLYIF